MHQIACIAVQACRLTSVYDWAAVWNAAGGCPVWAIPNQAKVPQEGQMRPCVLKIAFMTRWLHTASLYVTVCIDAVVTLWPLPRKLIWCCEMAAETDKCNKIVDLTCDTLCWLHCSPIYMSKSMLDFVTSVSLADVHALQTATSFDAAVKHWPWSRPRTQRQTLLTLSQSCTDSTRLIWFSWTASFDKWQANSR